MGIHIQLNPVKALSDHFRLDYVEYGGLAPEVENGGLTPGEVQLYRRCFRL